MRKTFTSAVTVITLLWFSTRPVLAGSVAGTGGATEATQLLNYGELAASYAKQATMVANQVTAQVTRVESLITQITNLTQLPTQLYNETVGPWKTQLGIFQKLQTTVSGLESSATQVSNLYNQSNAMATSLGMTGPQFLSAFQNLAQTRGGLYQQQYQQDIAAINQLAQRAQSLQTLADQNPQIMGDVQGLQLLAQQSNVMAASSLDIASLMQRQVMNSDLDRAESQQVQSDAAQAILNQANAMTQSNSTEQTSTNGTFNVLQDSQ